MSRKKNHKIWECPLHTFERQPSKKKDTNDYQNDNLQYPMLTDIEGR